MNTPVYDFVERYIQKKGMRAHMPGHKGRGILGMEQRDITEIQGADVLSESTGILGESQKNAASLFGAGASLYSTEGSSLAIKSMLFAALMYQKMSQKMTGSGARPFVLAARNVHRAMIDACGLLDLDVCFLYGREKKGICSGRLAKEDVRQELQERLQESGQKPLGVYLTSPDYLGDQCDIRGIAKVCHEYGILLLVDNAHGAYLAFLEENEHPIALGADLCCDSAHKTLPVLTGGAYLHLHQGISDELDGYARKGMAMFGSTSPSYLILQSLDLCNRYLAESFRGELAECVKRCQQFKKEAEEEGLFILSGEPLKIVLDTGTSGYAGDQIADELRSWNIECEFADTWKVVLMLTPQNDHDDWRRLYQWLGQTMLRQKKTGLPKERGFRARKAVRRMSIREAMLSLSEVIPVERAVGRVLAQETVSCPPAIPIAVSGEVITEEVVRLLKVYGIAEVSVVCASLDSHRQDMEMENF